MENICPQMIPIPRFSLSSFGKFCCEFFFFFQLALNFATSKRIFLMHIDADAGAIFAAVHLNVIQLSPKTQCYYLRFKKELTWIHSHQSYNKNGAVCRTLERPEVPAEVNWLRRIKWSSTFTMNHNNRVICAACSLLWFRNLYSVTTSF